MPVPAALDERRPPPPEAHPARRQLAAEVCDDLRAGGAVPGPALHKHQPADREPEDDNKHRLLQLDLQVPAAAEGDVVVRDLHGAGERAAAGEPAVPGVAVVWLHDHDDRPGAAEEGVLEQEGERAEARVVLLRHGVGLHQVQLLRRPGAPRGERLQLRQDGPGRRRLLRGAGEEREGRGAPAAKIRGGERAPALRLRDHAPAGQADADVRHGLPAEAPGERGAGAGRPPRVFKFGAVRPQISRDRGPRGAPDVPQGPGEQVRRGRELQAGAAGAANEPAAAEGGGGEVVREFGRIRTRFGTTWRRCAHTFASG